MPLGPLSLIVSKHYYGALSKSLEELDIDRYYSILHFLSFNNGCNQQHICNALAIDKTAMVKIMDYLLGKGYVSRRTNPKDRREHFVTLTAKGKRKTATIVKTFARIDAAAFAGISAAQRVQYYKVLDRLLQNLRALPSNDLFFNYRRTSKGTVRSK